MLPTLCILASAVSSAPLDAGWDRPLIPRLSRGQELVYRGTVHHEVLGRAIRFERSYHLEARALVLDTRPRGADLALLTLLRTRASADHRPAATAASAPVSARLELARVDLQGRVLAEPGTDLSVPLDGPPTIEHGGFVAVPRIRLTADHKWEVAEDGRPARLWTVGGTESINGTFCVRLTGLQQSDDWEYPRADTTAWQRRDTVWVIPRLGVAFRVERVIERREPARREASNRLTTDYELESDLVYPEPLLQDCRREIVRAHAFREAASPFLRDSGRIDRPAAEVLLARIVAHLDRPPETPYREAIRHLRGRLEAALRGESAAPQPSDEAAPAGVAAVGRPAPEFTATDLTGGGTQRLADLRGRPVLLAFYRPGSRTAEHLLQFCQEVTVSYANAAAVVALAVTADVEEAVRQRHALGVSVPVWSGSGIRQAYGAETTPLFVVIDGTGVVRATLVGWGSETAGEVRRELDRWLVSRVKR